MAEVRLPAPVKATRVDDLISEAGNEPGAWKFWSYGGSKDRDGLNYRCPCGCGAIAGVRFNRDPRLPFVERAAQSVWSFDGNVDVPTITPSIEHIGHWHGLLTAGVWTQA